MEISTDWAGFNPRDYLDEYYADVGLENRALLQFLANAFLDIPEYSTVLDFGGGPTIYALISACNKRREVHFCDYLETNLEEVRKWIQREPDAFDWHEFIRVALELEGEISTNYQVHQRASAIRKQVTRISRGNANFALPDDAIISPYDVVMSNFCADSATDDQAEWRKYVHNITSYLKPGGRLIFSALKEAHSYTVGKEVFPAVYLKQDDLIEVLTDVGCAPESISIESVPADRPSRHYQGLMFALATKSPLSGKRGTS